MHIEARDLYSLLHVGCLINNRGMTKRVSSEGQFWGVMQWEILFQNCQLRVYRSTIPQRLFLRIVKKFSITPRTIGM